MSRLAELIEQLCPDGVEYRALGDVGSFVRGGGLQKADFVEAGMPCVHYGQIHTRFGTSATKAVSYVSEAQFARLKHAEYGDLLIATTSEDDEAVGKATAWLGDGEVAISGDMFYYRHNLEPKYVSYFFASSSFQEQKRPYLTGAKVRRIADKGLSRIQIPVPPVEIQREIVRILDQFTTLEAELEAELEARRTQYEHYRNYLLSYKFLSLSVKNLGYRTLEEIFDTRNGYTPPKNSPSLWEHSDVPWFRMEDIRQNGGVLGESLTYVASSAIKGGRVFPAGSILVATTATIGAHALITVPHLANQQFTSLQLKESFHDSFDRKFLYYYCFLLDEYCRNHTNVSSFASVDMQAFRSFRFPIVPMKLQRDIVAVLDRFDALVNDISSGLPAEIEARRTQYEYYRDRLLSFPEKSAD